MNSSRNKLGKYEKTAAEIKEEKEKIDQKPCIIRGNPIK